MKEVDVVPHEGSWLGCESCWMHVVALCESTGSILVDQSCGSWLIKVVDSGGCLWWIFVDPSSRSLLIPVMDPSVSLWSILLKPLGGSWLIHMMDMMDPGESRWQMQVDPDGGSFWIVWIKSIVFFSA